MPPLPTGRKPAHAARPTRPRYGNSLRKTLSERECPKPLQEPTPSHLVRLCRSQLRRLSDRPFPPGQLHAFIQYTANRLKPTNTLSELRRPMAALLKPLAAPHR